MRLRDKVLRGIVIATMLGVAIAWPFAWRYVTTQAAIMEKQNAQEAQAR